MLIVVVIVAGLVLAYANGANDRKTIGSPHQLGKILCLTGASLVMAVVLYQGATWWLAAGDWHRNYFLQRCGFVVVTSVDIPMLQLLAIGLVMIRQGRRSCLTSTESACSPEV